MKVDSQKKIYRVYIDSTIPSYLVSNPSRVAKTAERQRITRQFWDDSRFEFILSDYVVEEISIGNREQAANRQHVVDGLTVVVAASLELDFARLLVAEKALPHNAFTDAVHVAVAATHNILYLATWNFAHLANPHTKPRIEQICRNAGYTPPHIDTPEVILEVLSHV